MPSRNLLDFHQQRINYCVLLKAREDAGKEGFTENDIKACLSLHIDAICEHIHVKSTS